MEQVEKSSVVQHNWSVAATYYLEDARAWPDSGNPQNQLAVLATYVGDEFLALYHCVRSLAVKEPFPDAWNNLILLFERNRSSDLHSLSSDAEFDFLNPFERSDSLVKSE
ncbi:protein SMG7L-like [Hibiscus syriacus]|uniref:protein SMG7L-like n=1 Tax=Hibiscus syriacus TaxID=106335 RepID=UPI001923E264|nr:protein SMG7L-like [Hibiscus syriacus]